MKLSSGKECILYHIGHNSLSLYTHSTDPLNAGLALLKQMQFIFTPIELKDDITFTVTETEFPADEEHYIPKYYSYHVNYSGNYSPGMKFDLYSSPGYSQTYTMQESGNSVSGLSTEKMDFSNYWIIIGNAIYGLTVVP